NSSSIPRREEEADPSVAASMPEQRVRQIDRRPISDFLLACRRLMRPSTPHCALSKWRRARARTASRNFGDFEHLHSADGSAQYRKHRPERLSGSPMQSRSARRDDGKAILDLKVGSNSSRFGADDAERRLPRLG